MRVILRPVLSDGFRAALQAEAASVIPSDVERRDAEKIRMKPAAMSLL